MKKTIRNITNVFKQATSEEILKGGVWYYKAQEECLNVAEELGVPTEVVIGCTAFLSPGLTWERNIPEAVRLICKYQDKGPEGIQAEQFGVYGSRNKFYCLRLLEGESFSSILRGREKVWNFYHNLLTPADQNFITIDSHARNLAVGFKIQKTVKPGIYRKISEDYKIVAAGLGLLPNQVQAITWLTWRRLYGRYKKM